MLGIRKAGESVQQGLSEAAATFMDSVSVVKTIIAAMGVALVALAVAVVALVRSR